MIKYTPKDKVQRQAYFSDRFKKKKKKQRKTTDSNQI